ncbi:MAG TPA: hypothetical protein VEX86_04180 [Longimicrobium sp.]|nr:hypothetical protein [Longimicrobium sp.]
MPQVHIRGVHRHGLSRESVAVVIQQYTGMGFLEARAAATRAVAGERVSVDVDDFYAVYELADLLTDMGVDAEADESDY